MSVGGGSLGVEGEKLCLQATPCSRGGPMAGPCDNHVLSAFVSKLPARPKHTTKEGPRPSCLESRGSCAYYQDSPLELLSHILRLAQNPWGKIGSGLHLFS